MLKYHNDEAKTRGVFSRREGKIDSGEVGENPVLDAPKESFGLVDRCWILDAVCCVQNRKLDYELEYMRLNCLLFKTTSNL
jgi:hypothetical protein